MTTNARPPVATKPNRMTLGNLTTARKRSPDRVLIYGTSGVGKTTWAACAAAPVFLPTERGLDDLGAAFSHVKAFPHPESFDEVLAAIRALSQPSEFKSFVIDSVDWIEPLIWRDLCAKNGWSSITEPGYGKGEIAAGEVWRRLMLELERMQDASGMDIILVGHSVARVIANPSGADFARYELKIDKHASAVVREWTKANLFATEEEFIAKGKTDKQAKVTSIGRRILHTQRGPGWDAKNRYGLKPTLALDYAEYAAGREAWWTLGTSSDVETLVAEARALLAEWAPDEATAAKANAAIEAAKTDAGQVARLIERFKTRITEKVSA